MHYDNPGLQFGASTPEDVSVGASHGSPSYLQMLVEEVQDQLVATLIFLLDLVLRQISTRSHPAMDLVREPLDNIRSLDALLPRLDVVLGLLQTWSVKKSYFRGESSELTSPDGSMM